jgi:CRP/FNR family transcriptional regulator, cyclic AMP receptor protein
MAGKVTLGSMVSDAISETTPRRAAGLGKGGVALLREVPLFSQLSHRHLRHLAAHAEEVRYSANRAIVREGTRGDSFFVIADGTATVRRGTRAIQRLGPGDFFGEIALLDGRPRSASVTSDTPLVVVRLTRSAFNKAIDTNPSMARGIMAELASRIRRLESPRGR